LASKAACRTIPRRPFGNAGLMVTAAISGLIDVDAVTPSVGRMVAALALKALPAHVLMALVGAGAALALR
jgi:uncharacterized membrane protein (DUF4010 family)